MHPISHHHFLSASFPGQSYAGIHNHNGTLSLRALFSTRAGVTKLLSFLQTSSVAMRLHHTGTIALARPNTPEGVG